MLRTSSKWFYAIIIPCILTLLYVGTSVEATITETNTTLKASATVPAATPDTTSTPVPSTFIRKVNLPINDFVYSPSDLSIYASVPSIVGPGRGNTITKINPTDGAIGSSVFVGSEPNKMAVSGDGQTIYVKLDGAQAIRRFDVPSQTAGLQFYPQGPFYYVEDMVVQPGNSQVIAIANGFEGVAIYDNGVQRPVYGDGGAYGIWSIDFASPTTLYGYDNYSSGFELIDFTVSSTGVTGINIGNNLISGFGLRIKYSNGLIYATGGRVVNPSTRTIVGSFASGGSTMAIDSAAGRIYFLYENVLTAYDTNTFLLIGSVTLPALNGTPYNLVRWGENGLAFRVYSGSSGSNSQLYLVQSTLVSTSGIIPTGLQFGAQTYSNSESGSFQVTVTRSGDLTGTSTVNYATADGTATAGQDFTATNGTLSFAPGEASKTIAIPIINDNIFEGNETFNFILSNPSGAGIVEILSPGTSTLTITDNDFQPVVSAPNLSVNEPRITGTTTALFTVRFSNPTMQTATFNYATTDGTATAGSDYIATSGTLTFSPLETTKTIAVQILADDNVNEPSETFKINFSNALNVSVNNSLGTATIINYNPQTARHTSSDFDSDGKTDISIFRPGAGEWWYQQSSDNNVRAFSFGTSTDKIVPADYDGDGKTDAAFFRPSTGEWFVLRSSDLTFFAAPFGNASDIPSPGDFDGDGKADLVVFRPDAGTWFINKTTGGVQITPFGTIGDYPVVADYDADGKADIAIYRATGDSSNSEWWILRSSSGLFATPFGRSTDKPVQGDYTGDGKADVAFYRPSTSEWFVLRSNDLTFFAAPFGTNGDIPVPGDYDGDGKFDFGVLRPSSATWFVNKSTGGTLIQVFGSNGDIAVPSAYVP